ncbi:MAG: radical SAM protein [Deltaproteobacteria bacterium]|nr:radical SAM protein [Deltaproteobacteria bacterium]
MNAALPRNNNSISIKTIPFNDMMLIITEGCNLRCSYCYENGKEYDSTNAMSWPTAKKAVDFFFAQVPPEMDRTTINFFGGEPLLAFDLIKKVVAYSYPHPTIVGYGGKRYNYVINTNGTILTDEMYEFYARLGKKINLRVSVDGYKEKHDFTRKSAQGKGSWFLLEKNLPRFRELKEKYGVRVNLVTTINKSTYKDLYYNWTNLHELTGMQIASLFIHEEKWEKEDYQIIREQALLLHDYSLRHNVKFFLTTSATGADSAGNGALFSSICNAGIKTFSVNHAGDIFACHRAYYYGLGGAFKLGNIETGLDEAAKASIYKINNMKMLPAKCRECPSGLREKCHICMATNKGVNGDYYTVADDYCLMMQELNSLLSAREIKDKIDKIGKSRNWLERKIPKRERDVTMSSFEQAEDMIKVRN